VLIAPQRVGAQHHLPKRCINRRSRHLSRNVIAVVARAGHPERTRLVPRQFVLDALRALQPACRRQRRRDPARCLRGPLRLARAGRLRRTARCPQRRRYSRADASRGAMPAMQPKRQSPGGSHCSPTPTPATSTGRPTKPTSACCWPRPPHTRRSRRQPRPEKARPCCRA
jgi:hypothetical protein